jgi:hypothetical protein
LVVPAWSRHVITTGKINKERGGNSRGRDPARVRQTHPCGVGSAICGAASARPWNWMTTIVMSSVRVSCCSHSRYDSATTLKQASWGSSNLDTCTGCEAVEIQGYTQPDMTRGC